MIRFFKRFDMKDMYSESWVPEKINHFIFQCEIFDKKNETVRSRDIQIELSDFEFITPRQSMGKTSL